MPELSARFETTAFEHDLVRDERIEWAGDFVMKLRIRTNALIGHRTVFEALGRQFCLDIAVATTENGNGIRLVTFFLLGPDWMLIYGDDWCETTTRTKIFYVRNRPAMERDTVMLMMMMIDDA